MITFSRLLELSGRPLLVESLTPRQATNIFKFHGATDDDMADAASLKKARKRLMMANHPDKAGEAGLEAAKEINAAYDALKDSALNSKPRQREEPKQEDYPVWAMAGYSGGMRPMSNIYRQNYRDINFIKKTMWEKSGHSKTAYTITSFDGRYNRGVYTAYGSPAIFDEMAKAMIEWDDFFKPRAIFAQKYRDDQLLLIYSDGKFHHPPIVIDPDSENQNPWNDTWFRETRLPEMLDKIRDQ